MTHYKATDPNGNSFGAPEVTWRVGRITRDALPAGTTLCRKGLLHAATVETEALASHVEIDIRRGYRLFAVEPRGPVVADDTHPHKVGCRAWKVTAELPAWQALGPQGRQVLEIIERAGRLTGDEAVRLIAAGYAAGYAARDAARDAAGYATWGAAGYAAWYAAGGATWGAAWCAGGGATWGAAGGAARDAALAVLTWDLCDADYTPAMRDLLLAPWREVIGLPEGL